MIVLCTHFFHVLLSQTVRPKSDFITVYRHLTKVSQQYGLNDLYTTRCKFWQIDAASCPAGVCTSSFSFGPWKLLKKRVKNSLHNTWLSIGWMLPWPFAHVYMIYLFNVHLSFNVIQAIKEWRMTLLLCKVLVKLLKNWHIIKTFTYEAWKLLLSMHGYCLDLAQMSKY